MKIILVNKFLYPRGGDCTYTFALGDLLKSKGHQVFYWGMKHPKNFNFPYKEYFPEFIDFEEMNVKKNFINVIKVIFRSIYSFYAKRKLVVFIKKINPDVVHLNNIHSHLTPSIIDGIKRLNIPIVWTLHDFELICPAIRFLSQEKLCERCKKHKYYNTLLNKCKKGSYSASFITMIKSYIHLLLGLYNKVDYFIAPSNFLKNKFIEYGYPKSKIVFIRNFLSPFPEYCKVSEYKSYVLFFGIIEKWKGIYTLIKAFEKMEQLNLKIIGSGSESNNLLNYIKKNNINNISLLGYKKWDELKVLISRSSFVVFPSEWYENCPYGIMESMSLGKPIIGSNIGGIKELINDGITGFLFKMGSKEDLKEKIEYLSKRPKLIQIMGVEARKRALKEFRSELFYSRIIRLYKNTIKENNYGM